MAENKMEQYCKLPIPITAYQTDKEMDIETLEGTMHASVGDWIITGVNGEQYPCKPDIFAKTYIKYGQANKMEIIAALFGKKYYEEFTITNDSSDYYECRAKFTEWGLMCLIDDLWQISETVLNDLLVGEAEIIDAK